MEIDEEREKKKKTKKRVVGVTLKSHLCHYKEDAKTIQIIVE